MTTAERDHALIAADMVGLAEIAIRAGVTNPAVANWAKRKQDFPSPVRELICGPVYSWAAVAAWLDKHDMPNSSYNRGLSDVAVTAIAAAAGKVPGGLWPDVAREHGVSARTVQLVVQARAMGEDYGWHTRQRRESRS